MVRSFRLAGRAALFHAINRAAAEAGRPVVVLA